METKYPTLRRPKRKLCYLTNKESPSKKWTGTLTLGDIDRMFDDLDPSSHNNDGLSPPSPLLQTFDTEPNQCEREASPVPQEGHLMEKLPRCQTVPKGDVLHPATRSPSPKLDIDLEIPFKAHMPVKTSSPIEENMVVEEPENEKDQVVSPLLFACEDEGKEEAKMAPLLIQNPQCIELVMEGNDDSEFESPPSKVVISKPKMSSHENKVEGSCKESRPVKEKTPKQPQPPVLEGKRKSPRQKNVDPPVSAVKPQPELAAPKKNSENVHRQSSVESTCVGKDMTAFLKKLRDAGQPKPAWKSLSPVKVSTPPPEPEDDFLILEDDTPLLFSIPSKTATSKKQRQSRTSSSDKDSSTDKDTKDSPLETAQKQQESEQTKNKLGSETVDQKTKKMKGKKKKNEVTEPGNDKGELSSPEDPPAGDIMEEEKPNKKKQLKKEPSKESDKEEEQLKDGASGETHKEKPTRKTEKKAQKSSDKSSKSLKDGNEKAKTSRAKSLKGGRKVTQESDAVKETVYVEAVKEQSQSGEERADAEDLGSDKEIINSEAQTEKDLADEKDEHNKLPVVSEGSSSEDSQIIGKRKRRQPGQWWLDHQITEETKVTDNLLTVKKSKQSSQEPSAAVPSPVKAKRDRVLTKRNQTQTAPSSSHNTNKAKEKKTRQKKNRNTRADARPDKVFPTTKVEQFEEPEQQEVADQDLNVQSSPLNLSHRDHSHNSGEQVFQRVYHHVSNENRSLTPAPVSPSGPREQLRAAEPERRRRKPPGTWWTVDEVHQNVESVSSQSQKQAPKPRPSKRSRSPGLGTPKNGNMAFSSKPQGGAPVSLLKPKPLSAPKTVKRSLATFKDIFTSAAETPTVVSRREAGQKTRRQVTARPAEEVAATNLTILSKTDGGVFSMDAAESRSNNHETPQDSRSQSHDRLKLLRSGPSSMIELEQYEEDDSLILTHPRDHAALSVSDLCAPPLKPLVLQPKDKASLTEWFKSLWSIPADSIIAEGAEITPDQFDWYFYQGRAIGFLEDLNCGSFCNGKILQGSYMKKPLWVDHSATTVFNLLTSSVSVTINGKESRFNPGQSFMVPCGHAYSIQNITAQPAVLYFTRILAENSD